MQVPYIKCVEQGTQPTLHWRISSRRSEVLVESEVVKPGYGGQAVYLLKKNLMYQWTRAVQTCAGQGSVVFAWPVPRMNEPSRGLCTCLSSLEGGTWVQPCSLCLPSSRLAQLGEVPWGRTENLRGSRLGELDELMH